MMAQKKWRRVVCRLRGHRWETAEVPVYRPDGSTFIRERRWRFCARCSARG
jgi:hypothetical protein